MESATTASSLYSAAGKAGSSPMSKITSPGDNVYVVFDPNELPTPAGFSNPGSICWLNSLLQALLTCTSLGDVMIREEKYYIANQFAGTLAAIFRKSRAGDPSQATELFGTKSSCIGKAIDSNESSRLLVSFQAQIAARKMNITMGYQQECTNEAFTLFIDLITSKDATTLFRSSYRLDVICPICARITSSMRDYACQICCLGRLPVSTPKEFSDYLRIHTNPVLQYTCPAGHKPDRVSREERLKLAREILVVAFDKFFGKYLQYYPETLEFPTLNGAPLKYQLVATIEHNGSMGGGHYYARCLRKTPGPASSNVTPASIANPGASGPASYSAFILNDSGVSPGNLAPLESTYMLFYHMIG